MALAFVITLAVSVEVCTWWRHPRDPANKWVACTTFAGAVAAAIGVVVLRSSDTSSEGGAEENRTIAAPSARTVVEGHSNRVAGPRAAHNDFGNHPQHPGMPTATSSSSRTGSTQSGEPTQNPFTPEATNSATPTSDVRVIGDGNRVAGADAHDNSFGDGAGGGRS